jgi:integrase
MRKPFYRKSRSCWFVKDDLGKFIRLDPDEKKAFRIWQRMVDLSDFKHHDATVEAIFEGYLDSIQPELTKLRFESQVYFLEAFSLWYGATKKARAVTKADVLRWVRAERTIRGKLGQWSIARQRDAGTAVKRALSWAIRRGYLPFSDVSEMEFQTPLPRQSTISYEAHRTLVSEARKSDRTKAFALVLIALRHSGARPISIRELTPAEVVGTSWVFPTHKTGRKTGKPLVVRCNGCLQTLTTILLYNRKAGHLFLNSMGKQWTKNAIVLQFRKLCQATGLHGVTAYSYRHAFATDLLQSGESIATVAALLGHTSPAMVAQVYGHLDQRHDHLAEALKNMRRP